MAERQISASEIADALRRQGLIALKDGVDAIIRQLRNESDQLVGLRLIIEAIRGQIERTGGGTVVSADLVSSVIAAETRGDDDFTRESIQVVSAFDTPKFRLDPARRVYRCVGSRFSLHADASAKASIHEERLSFAHDRLLRHPGFSPPPPGSRAAYIALGRIDDLPVGIRVSGPLPSVVLLGVLTQPEDGLWSLEDATGRSVALDLSNATRNPGLFTETAVVLLSGVYDSEGFAPGFEPVRNVAGAAGRGGPAVQQSTAAALSYLTEGRVQGVIRVAELSHPPAEPRSVTLDAMGVEDPFGAYHTPAEREKMESLLQTKGVDSMVAVLSDVHLDSPEVLDGLRTLLDGFSRTDSVPSLFILMGNFSSRPFGQHGGDRRRYMDGFAKLRSILIDFADVCQRTHFVLVPGTTDPGSAPVLPRPPLPTAFVQPLLEPHESLPRITLASNPCRIRFFTREIVVFRHEVSARLRRRAVLPPVVHLSGQAGGGGAEMVTDLDGEGQEQPDSEVLPARLSALSWPVTRHAATTLIQQAHLLPLPLSMQALYWEFDHAMRMHPAPHAVVIGEEQDAYTHIVGADESGKGGVAVFNPGSFATLREFALYRPAQGSVEPSSVIPQDEDEAETGYEGMPANGGGMGEFEGYDYGQDNVAFEVAAGGVEAEFDIVGEGGRAEEEQRWEVEEDLVPSSQPTVLSDGSILGAANPYIEQDDAIPEDEEEGGHKEDEEVIGAATVMGEQDESEEDGLANVARGGPSATLAAATLPEDVGSADDL